MFTEGDARADLFYSHSRAQQVEPDLGSHPEHVPELDVEVTERLQEAGVLERPRVDRVVWPQTSEREHG